MVLNDYIEYLRTETSADYLPTVTMNKLCKFKKNNKKHRISKCTLKQYNIEKSGQ